MASLDDLVARLQKANWAYHNNGHQLMTDAEYDRALEELRRLSPAHPFLSVVGAPVPAGSPSVMLPTTMGSQDKVRAGEGGLERWLKRAGGAADAKQFIVSEKLDGLSALYIRKEYSTKLYLRGDGVKGVDVSRALRGGIDAGNCSADAGAHVIVRGELILSKASTPPESIGRSIVNGWIHRAMDVDAPLPEGFQDIHFVAYQVLEPAGMTRVQQMEWLVSRKFKVPWWAAWPRAAVCEDFLKKELVKRKEGGAYPIDGLIVATAAVPVGLGGGEARNPPDSVAFKMSSEDQKAETSVVEIIWTASRQGIWVPRIRVKEVRIGGAKIQWLSAHNAAFIRDNRLGPGARIVVRRSGDVIPALDEVLAVGPTGAEMPAEGLWAWDERQVQALATDAVFPEKVVLHALQMLEVDGVGPGLVKKMVDAGYDTVLKVWKAEETGLAKAIGPGRAGTLLKSLKEGRARASYSTLLVASNLLPRGVGERKLRALFEKEADPRKWTGATMEVPDGWSDESLKGLWRVLPKALAWIEESFPGSVAPIASASASAPAPQSLTAPTSAPPTKYVVFTGVRDKNLEKKLLESGWDIQSAVTSKTNVLVVADGDLKESGKTKKATDLGVPIQKISEFRSSLG
jgi:NAD-dependent DNA ligase